MRTDHCYVLLGNDGNIDNDIKNGDGYENDAGNDNANKRKIVGMWMLLSRT